MTGRDRHHLAIASQFDRLIRLITHVVSSDPLYAAQKSPAAGQLHLPKSDPSRLDWIEGSNRIDVRRFSKWQSVRSIRSTWFLSARHAAVRCVQNGKRRRRAETGCSVEGPESRCPLAGE